MELLVRATYAMTTALVAFALLLHFCRGQLTQISYPPGSHIHSGSLARPTPVQPQLASVNNPQSPLGGCFERPGGCMLSCPNGYLAGFNGGCLCLCRPDPCLGKLCQPTEICISNLVAPSCVPKAPRQSSRFTPISSGPSSPVQSHILTASLAECPHVPPMTVQCPDKCNRDADCPRDAKCCFSGCGKDCLPVSGGSGTGPLRPTSLPIQPLLVGGHSPSPYQAPGIFPPAQVNGTYTRIMRPVEASTGSREKPGQCPSRSAVSTDESGKVCLNECGVDADCAGVNKCCSRTGGERCGKICTPPERAGYCIHLLSATERLPHRHLSNGFVPSCSAEGEFNPVQCDTLHCWCVEVESGREIFGTKVERNRRAMINCKAPRSCPEHGCLSGIITRKCHSFGVVTDEQGCPLADCRCRALCEDVKCVSKFDECQLVEPDCATPPCTPVPRCLLNPCPSGPPMMLSNGVTALCKKLEQCYEGYWCHQVGYNGLGFCCPMPESLSRPGHCETKHTRALSSRSGKDCASECKVDSDCALGGKCCFDGCGLSCVTAVGKTGGEGFTLGSMIERPSSRAGASLTLRHNRQLLLHRPELSECPPASLLKINVTENECSSSDDCDGLRRCCASMHLRTCQYPLKTSACLQQAITHDIFDMSEESMKCDSDGNFERIQCIDQHCFCVDQAIGREVSGTRISRSTQQTPDCERRRIECRTQNCQRKCPTGSEFELDEDGCPTCRCSNPCKRVECKRPNEFCLMAEMECLSGSNGTACPPQPRCVENVCKQGRPLLASGSIEPCHGLCSVGYWCYMVGLPIKGGICCPVGQQSPSSVKSAIDVITQQHLGMCPGHPAIVSSQRSDGMRTCRRECLSDEECAEHQKCCFNGCGLACTGVDVKSTMEAASADHETTTPCLNLKSALREVAAIKSVACTAEGHFERVQCDREHCWCVDEWSGDEIEGTRSPSTTSPDCDSPRPCPMTFCRRDEGNCTYGRARDAEGCDTCECMNPCKGIDCAGGGEDDKVCVPQEARCSTKGSTTGDAKCPHVPKCVVNVCQLKDALLLHRGSFRPVACHHAFDCPRNYHCRIVNSDGGVCCFGIEPLVNPGRCPKTKVNPLIQKERDRRDLCQVKCTQDKTCKPTQKCCFNGCGLACSEADFDGNNLGSSSKAPSAEVVVSHPIVESMVTPVSPTLSRSEKIGECYRVEPIGSSAICNNAGGGHIRDSCTKDEDCPESRKCCFNGCAFSCMHPKITTECLHAEAAARTIAQAFPNNIHEPACEQDGSFRRIQRQNAAWCVDRRGREVEGTKTLSILLNNCDKPLPKLCPPVTCVQQCPFGFETNALGCNQCKCRDQCIGVRCPLNSVCRMMNVECLSPTECSPVPKCVVNACLRGEPLLDVDSRQLMTCDEKVGPLCPAGWYCLKLGIEDTGYCCPGLVPQKELRLSALQCPSLPTLYGSLRSNQIKCRLSSECARDEPCCFNGVGTSCFPAKHSSSLITQASNDSGNDTVVTSVWHSPEKSTTPATETASAELFGECPANVFKNPACTRECKDDAECAGQRDGNPFFHCCPYGCGTKCQYPQRLTSCAHLMLSTLKETNRRAEEAKHDGVLYGFIPHCDTKGLFEKVQCNADDSTCWCVEPTTGIEIAGTRAEGNEEPNCPAPRRCLTQCGTGCEHGVKLDKSGCPLNSMCECRNPCDDFKCSNETDICVLKSAECLGKPCPSVPSCIPNPCGSFDLIAKGVSARPIECSGKRDCGGNGRVECKIAEGGNADGGMLRRGLCCIKGGESDSSASESQFSPTAGAGGFSSSKVGMCPQNVIHPLVGGQSQPAQNCEDQCVSDGECPGLGKCCQMGCKKTCIQPLRPTNCVNMLYAIQELQREHVRHSIHIPSCTARVGTFTTNQCDKDGTCWCVDPILGRPFLGTRKANPRDDVCLAHKHCPILCDEERLELCLFGVEMGSDGCPKTSECKCRSPCQMVNCPRGTSCVMRQRECQEESCLPVPKCESDPCGGKGTPSLNAHTGLTRACRTEGGIQLDCEPGSHCTAIDEYGLGVCCLGGATTELTRVMAPAPNISHQQAAKSAEACGRGGGSLLPQLTKSLLLSCNPSKSVCPSTHLCIAASNSSFGTCCPTKRHVCELKMDEGTCTVATPRYYYDSESESCLQFMWRGCGGNLNNFLSLYDCQRFCAGGGGSQASTIAPTSSEHIRLDDDGLNDGFNLDHFYNVAFTLIGPLNREKHGEEFQKMLKAYLQKQFNLKNEELADMDVGDDNTVRFTVFSPEAARKADEISRTVSEGRFRFAYNGDAYRAEPSTFTSHQASSGAATGDSNMLFWVILVLSAFFALVVIFLLCCGYNFLRLRSQMDRSSSVFPSAGLPSPAPYSQIIAGQRRHSSSPRNPSDTATVLALATDASGSGRAKIVSAGSVIARRNLLVGENNRLLIPAGNVARVAPKPSSPPANGMHLTRSEGSPNHRNYSDDRRRPIVGTTLFY